MKWTARKFLTFPKLLTKRMKGKKTVSMVDLALEVKMAIVDGVVHFCVGAVTFPEHPLPPTAQTHTGIRIIDNSAVSVSGYLSL